MTQNNTTYQILLSQFQMLWTAYLQKTQQDHQSLNLFITVLSGGIAVIIILFQSANSSKWEPFIPTLLVLIILLAIGWTTLRSIVSSRIVVDEYLRGLDRIRIYFAQQDKTLVDYFIYPLTDLPTSVISFNTKKNIVPGSHHSMETIVAINSFLFSVICVDLVLILWNKPLVLNSSLIIRSSIAGLTAFVVSAWLQVRSYRNQLTIAGKRALSMAKFKTPLSD